MKLIQKIRMKEIVSIMLIFMFLAIFVLLAIIFDTYKVSFKEYVKGFKTSYVSNEEDTKKIDFYNTTILKSKEVYSTDYTFETVNGKTRKTLTLYIAMLGEKPVYIIKNLKNVDKEGDTFVFKGTLKNYDKDFHKIYSKLPADLILNSDSAIVYLDTDKGWKGQVIFQLIFAYTLIPFLIYLIIMRFFKLIDYRKSSSYKSLMRFGNPEEIIRVIENEKVIKKVIMPSLAITENWYVIANLSSLSFVPKNMIIGFSLIVHSGKSYNSIHLYLLDGTIEVIQTWKKTSMQIIELLKSKVIHLDHLDKNTFEKVKKMHNESRKVWEEYETLNNSIYNDLKNEDENSVPNKVRKQFLELVKPT